MFFIENNSVEPYYNQALEEYLLNNFDEDIFLIWQNHNAIVVGKHQNTLAEINYEFVNANNVKVVRRLSGGGTVFHDLGNINFTFIKKYEGQNPSIDFKKFLTPVIEFLSKMGINAEFSGRNDILVDGEKISGNAEHIFHRQKKILHHGTLLFNSDLSHLKSALKDNSEFYTDKAVKSIRSKVTNISQHLSNSISTEDFINYFIDYFKKKEKDFNELELSENDIKNIEKLDSEKYSTWQWNYGYSPKYIFKKQTISPLGNFQILLEVEKGEIKYAKVFSDFFKENEILKFEKSIIGKQHRIEDIAEQAKITSELDYLKNISESELINMFF